MTDESIIPTYEPEDVRRVPFRDREFIIATLKDGQAYVSIKSLADAFGLQPRAQQQRLIRHKAYYGPYTTKIVLPTVGGPRATLCLMASAIPLFLTGININAVQDPESATYL